MAIKTPLYRYLFSLALIISISLPATHIVAAQETTLTQEQQKSYVQTARDYWTQWYNFRKKYVYPAEGFLRLISAGNYDIQANPRRHFPDVLNTGHPILAPSFVIGIIDAAFAQKPAEEIVRDDVVHFASYVGCLFAFNKAWKTVIDPMHANPIFNAIVKSIPENQHIPEQIRNNLDAIKLLVSIGAYYYKHKIVGLASKVISTPTGYIAYRSVKAFKNRKNRVPLQKLPKITVPVRL